MNKIIVFGDVHKATSLLKANTKITAERKNILLEAIEKGAYEVSQSCTEEEYKTREAERLQKVQKHFGPNYSKVYLYHGEKSIFPDTKGWYKIGQQVYNPGFHEVKKEGNYTYLLYKGPQYSTPFRKSSLNTDKLLEHAQIAYTNAFISQDVYQQIKQKYA